MDKWLIDKAVGKRIVDRETLVTKQHANKNSLRNYGFDNIRALLIIAVVFGHLLELSSFKGSALIYQTIYSFHMPAFVFLVGYWARYDVKKILFNYVLPYVLFQTIYIYFAQNVLGIPTELQYAVPYWHLWFLMACMFYQLLLPLYPTLPAKKQLMTLISVFVLALFVGYDDTVGYYGTLSRFFVFQPYFILGYYYRGKETQISKACAGKNALAK